MKVNLPEAIQIVDKMDLEVMPERSREAVLVLLRVGVAANSLGAILTVLEEVEDLYEHVEA